MEFSSTYKPVPQNKDVLTSLLPPSRSIKTLESQRSMQPIVTGTSVLGVKFDGGVAIAADMLGSYGSMARFPGLSRMTKVNESTVVAASGDYADFQFISKILEQMMIENAIENDVHEYLPNSIYSYLRLLMYQKRSRFEPLWNTLLVAGWNKDRPFLGYVDKLGVAYEEKAIATGYGAYMALPLMRKAQNSNGNMSKVEAVKLLMECLKVLYYRDARSINKFELAIVTNEGVTIESNLTCSTNWEIAHLVKGYE